jgi:hypothetical protein
MDALYQLTIVNIKNLEVLVEVYNNFIGLDIGKFNFIVAIYGSKETKEYDNNNGGVTNL